MSESNSVLLVMVGTAVVILLTGITTALMMALFEVRATARAVQNSVTTPIEDARFGRAGRTLHKPLPHHVHERGQGRAQPFVLVPDHEHCGLQVA
ncbi:MAG TPA: hypothetical protein PKG80_10590, partial [Acidobacteriota bacterium]|nr:hypothetical protein [Acidobacteriota bacterium]